MHTTMLHTYRFAIGMVSACLIVAALAGLSRLQTEADYRVYFSQDDPLLALEASVNSRFGQADSALLLLEADPQSLLSSQSMQAYQSLEQSLLALPVVIDVGGFYQFVDAIYEFEKEGDEDLFADAADQQLDLSPAARLQRLQDHPRGRDLVSKDRRFALIEVRVSLPGDDSAREVQQTMDRIEELATVTLLDSGVVDAINYSGALVLNQAYIDVVRHDLRLFVPGLLLLIGLVMFAVLRNWRLVLLSLTGGLLSAAMAMGLAGWLGWTLAAINAFTPIIIVSLQLSASMHLVVSFVQRRASGLSRRQAMQCAVEFNLRPMVLSALTTAGGFLLLATSPSPPIRVVGYSVAIGVGIAFLYNLVLLPLLLPRLRLSVEQALGISARLTTEPIMNWVRSNKRVMLIVASVLTVVSLFSLGGARIDDSVYSYFPAEHGFSRGIRQLDRQFAGCVRLSYVLSGADGSTVLNEDFHNLQAGFSAWLVAQPEVGGVFDLYSLMQRQGLDLDAAGRYLQRRSVAAIGIEGHLTPELNATRVEVFLPALGSRELLAFDSRVNGWLQQNSGHIRFEGGIGPDLIFASLGQRNAYSMFVSLGVALAVIGLLLGLLFGNLTMALTGLACNLLPLLLVYTLWFAAGGYISLGAAVVLGMILGVVVDDTLHVLCKYRDLVGQGSRDPVRELSRRVLPAVWITSITLAAGLSVGLLSDFRPLRELSLLSAGVILAALLVDALILPAVLMMKRPMTK